MQRQIRSGLVVFREGAESAEPPIRKAHLVPIPEELDEDTVADVEEETADDEVGLQVMPSVIYKQSQVAVKHLRALMGDKAFPNPKDHEVIARLIRYVADSDSQILDFFAGSGTTGHSVIDLNRSDQGHRKFTLVEVGGHFETVMLPRLQRAMYAPEWKTGKPANEPVVAKELWGDLATPRACYGP